MTNNSIIELNVLQNIEKSMRDIKTNMDLYKYMIDNLLIDCNNDIIYFDGLPVEIYGENKSTILNHILNKMVSSQSSLVQEIFLFQNNVPMYDENKKFYKTTLRKYSDIIAFNYLFLDKHKPKIKKLCGSEVIYHVCTL